MLLPQDSSPHSKYTGVGNTPEGEDAVGIPTVYVGVQGDENKTDFLLR